MPKQVPSFDAYAWAEHAWLSYPTSRQYHPDMAKFIIDNSRMKGQVQYMGAYYIALEPEYAEKFDSSDSRDINLDIVYLDSNSNFKPTKNWGANQSKFKSIAHLAATRKPKKDMIGVYFFGELHQADGFVHWNVGFLGGNEMNFFDPVLDAETYQEDYDLEYDFGSRTLIAGAFNAKVGIFIADKRPQWVCQSGSPFTDLFCQSWSLLFLDIYCNNDIDKFLTIDFEKYQTDVVKSWIVCIVNKMKKSNVDWNIFNKGELRSFPYCLQKDVKGHPIVTALACKTTVANCADMVVNSFQ